MDHSTAQGWRVYLWGVFRKRQIMASFLPVKDATLLAWAQNFYAVANVAPTTYGLTAAQCTAFNTLVTNYQTALAACEPGVRNKSAVQAKNTAKAALKTNARLLAKLVEGTASVTNAQKAALGVNVRAMPSPIPAPSVSPQLDIVSVTGRTVTIRLHSSETGKRGKPAGVKGAAIFSYVGATAPTDPSAYAFQGNTTKTVNVVAFPESTSAGTTVWLTAMWFNERAMSGPACEPVSATIQYGMSSMAA
jgi:hypothetical protein